jgi:hypothetical protein
MGSSFPMFCCGEWGVQEEEEEEEEEGGAAKQPQKMISAVERLGAL